ncbi:MAG: DUF4249 family protein [Gemmatimonadetes bacterium]|nr:DUF4249 family protein [Gemmatimonadota bacterium]
MRIPLILLALLPLLSCDAPGPLKAERKPGDLFAPSEGNMVVVEAILVVDAPLPPVQVRRTVAPGDPYSAAGAALADAHVSIHHGDTVFDYHPDPDAGGRYLPPADAPAVEPGSTYELRVVTETDPVVRATTQTPPRMRIGEVVLLDDILEDDEYREVGSLRLFPDVNDVYQAPENQIEYTRVIMEARLEHDGQAAAYQFGATNLELNSPLLIDSDFFEEEDLERRETSPLLKSNDDGTIYVPWDGIYYTGRYKVKLYAVDQNWFDLVRTDNVSSQRESGEAGQGFQRPLFHVENGIGLFASACVDSFGFFVRQKGSQECSGCECWGCASSSWSGILGLSGRGSIGFEKEVTSGDNCKLSYEITGATTVVPCADCSFAWEFTLGNLMVETDTGGCGDAEFLSGYTFRFAQGTEVISEEDDKPHYSLYMWEENEGLEEGWEVVEGGWSFVPEEGEFAGRWLFGFPGD